MKALCSVPRDSKLQSQLCNFSSVRKYLSIKYMSHKVHELTLRKNVGVY